MVFVGQFSKMFLYYSFCASFFLLFLWEENSFWLYMLKNTLLCWYFVHTLFVFIITPNIEYTEKCLLFLCFFVVSYAIIPNKGISKGGEGEDSWICLPDGQASTGTPGPLCLIYLDDFFNSRFFLFLCWSTSIFLLIYFILWVSFCWIWQCLSVSIRARSHWRQRDA